MEKIDWAILDVLADDFESMNQIYPLKKYPDVIREEIVDRLFKLYNKGYIRLRNKVKFNVSKIKAEPEGNFDTKFWFGMTTKGAIEWEKYFQKFCDYSAKWEHSYVYNISFEKKTGYINGVTRIICLRAIKKIFKSNQDWQVDMTSLKDFKIKGFQASYYKYIHGGHRISFKLIKKVS